MSSASGPEVFDVAIIGGGLAGGTAALQLAEAGARVVVLEKESCSHHKVCGEFLSAEGLPILEKMGIDLDSLGASHIDKFRLHGPTRSSESKLPMAGRGYSREKLDTLILERAARAGAVIRRGVVVKGQSSENLSLSEDGKRLSTTAGDVVARRVIVATGKADYKGVSKREGRDTGLVGFKMHLKLKPSAYKKLKSHCDLFVFKGGYGGLAAIEDGAANFCFLIERSILKKVESNWNGLAVYIAKHNTAASHYLDGAEPLFPHFVTIAKVPYGFLRRHSPEAGIYCVGDQMAVIPSLTGDGMTIALKTGQAAAAAILEAPATQTRAAVLRPAETSRVYQREARVGLRTQIESAYLLHRLFKNPRACDWAAYAVTAFPMIIDFLFSATRCQLPGSTTLEPQVLGKRTLKARLLSATE